jgi:hypothetical protein
LVEFDGDASHAQMFLLPLKGDALRIADLRTIVADADQTPLCRQSDDEVIAAVAEMLARHDVHLHDRFAPFTLHVQTNRVVPSEIAPGPAPRAARVVARPAPPLDLPIFPAGLDAASQAAVLVAAAAAGEPFCPI